MTATGHFRCRKCSTLIDGMGSPCIACGTPQRVPVTFANGNVRYLPTGMSQADFDAWLSRS